MLSWSDRKDIRAAVADNVGVPTDVAERLAVDEEWMVWNAAARNSACTAAFLDRLAGVDAEKFRAAAANPSASPELISSACRSAARQVVRAGIENPSCPPRELAAVTEQILADRAAGRHLPPAVLGNLRTVARNPAAGAGLLARLAVDLDDDTARNAVENPSCAPRVVLAAVEADRPKVRAAAASSMHCPPESLSKLAVDPHSYVRRNAARNRRTPVASLPLLAADTQDWVIRRTVVARRDCPAGVLSALAGDADHRIRTGVAGNSATPPAALLRLAADPNSTTRLAARRNPATPPAGKAAAGLLAG